MRTSRLNAARLLAMVALPILICDQASKLLITSRMVLNQSVAVIRPFLNLTFTANPGAAFSLFTGLPDQVRMLFLSGVSVAAIVVLLTLIVRGNLSSLGATAMAMVLGGALGNLTDRLLRGVVIDFIDVHYKNWHYPVFNVADCAITIGVALILADSLMRARTPVGEAEPEVKS